MDKEALLIKCLTINNIQRGGSLLFLSLKTFIYYCLLTEYAFRTDYLLTGFVGRARKYKLEVFHTAQACEENQGTVFPSTARTPSQ